MEHYYSQNPTTVDDIKVIEGFISGTKFNFRTNNSVFSKGKVDFGSQLLVETIVKEEVMESSGSLLDIGCGYGAMGIPLAHFFPNLMVTMVDINERAVGLAKENAQLNKVAKNTEIFTSDGFEKITKSYDVMITNPPIRAGKQLIFSFYENAFTHLNVGGKLYIVIQKKQGSESSQKKLTELFGNCKIINRDAGYHILACSKK